MILRAVFLTLAVVAFALTAADVRHPRINLQSLGLFFLAVALLSAVWGGR